MTPSRRQVLRGLGAAVALPWMPSLARGAAPPAIERHLFWYIPVGMPPGSWLPRGSGTSWTFGPVTEPLARHRDRLTFVSGLQSLDYDLTPEADPHEVLGSAALTGDFIATQRTDGPHGGRSVDQLIADHLGAGTRFSSLELASESSFTCMSGMRCANLEHVSWSDARTPRSRETSVVRLFERLFGSAATAGDAEAQALRLARRRSVLDFVTDATARVQARLGVEDRGRLGDWLDGVRDVERRLGTGDAGAACATEAGLVDAAELADGRLTTTEHVERMHELAALALHCDQTRVLTYMIANETSGRAYPELGAADTHHWLTHHGGEPWKVRLVNDIDRWEMERLAHLLDLLASLRDPTGASLLDSTTVVALGGMGAPDLHSRYDLPVLLAGGRYQTGEHLRFEGRPHGDLLLTLLQRAGVAADRFGAEGSTPLALP